MDRMLILRHQYHFTSLPRADLVNKFFKRGGVCKIDNCVRRAAMSVTACRDWNSKSFGHLDHRFILRPRAKSIDLECMDPTPVLADEIVQQKLVALIADQLDIPQRMIKNNEY